MRSVLEKVGAEPLAAFTRKAIVRSRDARASAPAMARHFVETMRGMFRWAVDAEHIKEDPTRDVRAPKPQTDGRHTWTAGEIETFEAKWPLGTRERLAFDLLLYTGMRRGDVFRLGRQHVKSGVIAMRTAKTGQAATVFMVPPLAQSIAAGPCGELSFIVTDRGQPTTKEGFGNWFGEACRFTGAPGRAHGLRKALASRLAEAGATVSELDALFAWSGGGMASLNTRKASREKLALAAMARLGNENETSASYAQISQIKPQIDEKVQ
jgi:integrase